ncbi:hypothetical protein [Methylobacter luteus]|jgi:hypothetical protein|uniref:hypothetical protein n=1 Tax=Methylobacter luteus TaxID=415 RepID=UPI0004800229|nr:hypothetical protein [Methylobacter luteus]
MKTKLLIALLLAIGLATACTERVSHPMDMSQALENAASNADHEALAKHYEDAAREIQLKADEHKKLLSHYEAKGYVYGKQALDLQTHCRGLINAYEKAAEENLEMAKLHRQM